MVLMITPIVILFRVQVFHSALFGLVRMKHNNTYEMCLFINGATEAVGRCVKFALKFIPFNVRGVCSF